MSKVFERLMCTQISARYLIFLPCHYPLLNFLSFTLILEVSLHHDELISLSAHTNLNIDVIGVSEIWHSNDNPISSNVDIPGYTFLKTKSVTQNGDVGLYIRDSLTSNPNDFETVWVKFENTSDKNFLICRDF